MTLPGSRTCETLAGTLPLYGPLVGFAHFTPSSGRVAVSRVLDSAPLGSRGGWEPIRAGASPVSRPTATPHGATAESALTSASFAPQSPARSILLTGPR